LSFERAPLFSHLEELWRRALFCLIAFAALTGLAYYFSDSILLFLSKPLTNLTQFKKKFIYTELTEAFFSYLKVSLFTGMLFASPIFAFHIWRFTSLALSPEEQKRHSWLFICIPLLFYTGALTAYYLVCPMAWRFFFKL
jgi:sec-independent protein translocase protein TatC